MDGGGAGGDLDATIITSASKKQGTRATFKKNYGVTCWRRGARNTTESLAMFLRRRYSITATNVLHVWGISGSQHAQSLDVLHRSHAGVEDRVRCDKARGLSDHR
ncbi:hypothetical protein AQJ27_30945 [Streptomyces olivochromogenes]|nr:hypothetical protein AQJ27_30945 [Streptomyces olivochromogenes]